MHCIPGIGTRVGPSVAYVCRRHASAAIAILYATVPHSETDVFLTLVSAKLKNIVPQFRKDCPRFSGASAVEIWGLTLDL